MHLTTLRSSEHPLGRNDPSNSGSDGNSVTKIEPDALIRVRFLTSAQGGRNFDLVASNYGCPLFVDGLEDRGFDCRFVLSQAACIELGNEYEIEIKFLEPDKALAALEKGSRITLWEGRTIATGNVVEIFVS
jgi:hypothetical protein